MALGAEASPALPHRCGSGSVLSFKYLVVAKFIPYLLSQKQALSVTRCRQQSSSATREMMPGDCTKPARGTRAQCGKDRRIDSLF